MALLLLFGCGEGGGGGIVVIIMQTTPLFPDTLLIHKILANVCQNLCHHSGEAISKLVQWLQKACRQLAFLSG